MPIVVSAAQNRVLHSFDQHSRRFSIGPPGGTWQPCRSLSGRVNMKRKSPARTHGSPDNVAGVPASESIESAEAETLAVVSQKIGR